MPFNNKNWMRRAVPEGSLIGSRTAAIPIQPGFYIGVCLDRYSEKDMRRVHVFSGIGLNTESHLRLRMNNEFISNCPIDQLETMIPIVHEATAEYRKKYRSLEQFAYRNLEYMKEWRAVNGLLDVVIAHYLDPLCPLPEFKLTNEDIFQNIDIQRKYEFEHVETVLTLQSEWQSPDYEALKANRIQSWLAQNRLKPDFFNC